MRIALDATYSVDSQPSGIGIYSQQILHGLAETYSNDNFFYCYRPKQFRRAPKPESPNAKKKLLWPLAPPLRVDIFHALNQRVDRRPAATVISTFHDLFVMTGEYSSPDFRKRFAEQARKAAVASDLIIAVSHFTAGQISSLLKVEPQRIRVIPHGVVPPGSNIRLQREPIVLFVGALQLRKNVKRLVEAFEAMPEPWRLVLAGAPSGYRAEEILEQIDQSRLRSRIEVTGYISRTALDELFARASIFAFPSLDEGFGIPVLEAMAAGIPVLTSQRSGLSEIAEGAAMTIDPFRVDEIAAALNRLAANESLRRELTSAGLARVKEFTWRGAVEKTYAVYRELLGDREGR